MSAEHVDADFDLGSREARPAVRQALVLGAGGALGASWTVGALHALAEVEEFDPSDVDVVVGTSAGSVVGSLLCCGIGVAELVDRLRSDDPPRLEKTGPVNAFDVHATLTAIPRPVPRPGNLRLVARTARRPGRHTLMTVAAGLAPRGRGDLRPVADLISEAQGPRRWPVQPVAWIVAMDFCSGRRVVFGRAGSPRASLPDAVMASCAAPGFFPPVTIDGRRYVDGGAVSVTNADVLAWCGATEILVLAPMATHASARPWSATAQADLRLRRAFTRRLDAEVRRLAAGGATVRVLAPTAADLEVIGLNMMNPRRRREVLERSRVTTREQLRAATPPRGARSSRR